MKDDLNISDDDLFVKEKKKRNYDTVLTFWIWETFAIFEAFHKFAFSNENKKVSN